MDFNTLLFPCFFAAAARINDGGDEQDGDDADDHPIQNAHIGFPFMSYKNASDTVYDKCHEPCHSALHHNDAYGL